MRPCARRCGNCAASITGRRPSISALTGRLSRSKRPRRPHTEEEMRIIPDKTRAIHHPRAADPRAQQARRPQQPAVGAGTRSVGLERFLLLVSLLTGAISHGYHLFLYPLYITDEGIYMQQAWSVLREGRLSPYTYFYDHAPAGWLMIAGWVSILPHQFEAFGNAINTGRVLMLLVHLASVFLLFQLARRLSGSLSAAVVATFFFNLSPLAIYYQRQVLLDTLTVLCVLLEQLHRSQGSMLDPHSVFWTASLEGWLPKDTFLLAGGMVATLLNLVQSLRDRKRHRGQLVAALLATSYAFYLVRGSVMLEFYVVPLVPFLALNIGLLLARILHLVPGRRRLFVLSALAQSLLLASFFAVLLLPTGGYLLVHDEFGKVVPHDLYKLPLTYLQEQQLAYIRAHIPPTARIIMDDDLWVQLHDVRPYYPWAHSHWKAASDPAVRYNILARNWRNSNYIVLSNKMPIVMQHNNSDGSENYILAALQHARPIWQRSRGNISLAIYQVQK